MINNNKPKGRDAVTEKPQISLTMNTKCVAKKRKADNCDNLNVIKKQKMAVNLKMKDGTRKAGNCGEQEMKSNSPRAVKMWTALRRYIHFHRNLTIQRI